MKSFILASGNRHLSERKPIKSISTTWNEAFAEKYRNYTEKLLLLAKKTKENGFHKQKNVFSF